MTSYAVARGRENSIALTKALAVLQQWKGCQSKAEADQTVQAFIHMSFS